MHWEAAAQKLGALRQRAGVGGNARLLELTADSILQLADESDESRGQESTRMMERAEAAALLEQACVAEPLNIRLRIKVARLLASVARPERAWEQLANASATLSWLETSTGSVTGTQNTGCGG